MLFSVIKNAEHITPPPLELTVVKNSTYLHDFLKRKQTFLLKLKFAC